MKDKAILIYADDWEGLFVDGKLVDEGHTLNEGEERVTYFIALADKHNFDVREISWHEATEADNETLNFDGSFPMNIEDLQGEYGKV